MKRKVVAISISSALILLSAILIFYESEPGRSSDPPTDRERQKNVEPVASTPPIPTDSKPVVEVKAGKPERPELVLEPAYRLTVTVREAEGSLLAGVEVAVSEERTGRRSSPGRFKGITDQNGEALFTSIRKDRVSLSAVAEGHMRTSESAVLDLDSENHAAIILQPGGEMTGRVVDGQTGRPLEGFINSQRLMVTRTVINAERGIVGHGMRIDEDGYFKEVGLEPGPYEIEIAGANYRAVHLGPRTLEGGKTLDWGTIELRPGFPIEVHVVDSAGAPVEGARVSKQYGPNNQTLTDSEGNATVYCSSSGTVRIQARHSNYARKYSDEIQVTEDSDRPEVTITLSQGGTVVGTAYGEDGSILGSSSVGLSSTDVNTTRSAATDDDGQFRFEKVPAGRYRLTLRHRPVSHRASEVFTVPDGETVVQDARQPARRRLKGTVVDARGDAVPGCTIDFGGLTAAPDGGWTVSYPRGGITTDAEGSFVILDAQPRFVQVLTPSGSRVVYGLAGSYENLILRLPDDAGDDPAGTVDGQIRTVGSGTVVGGATVAISTMQDDGPDDEPSVQVLCRYQVRSGPDGRFQLDVPAGTLRMEITRSTNATEVRTVAVEAGRNVNADVVLYPAGNLQFLLEPPASSERRSRSRPGVRSRSRSRVTLEASIPDDPGTARIEHGYFGRRVSFSNLRLGATYKVKVTASGHAPFTASYEVTQAKDPIPIKLGE